MSDTSVPPRQAGQPAESEDAVDATAHGGRGEPDDVGEARATADEPAAGPDPAGNGAAAREAVDGSVGAPATALDEPASGARTEVVAAAAAAPERPAESVNDEKPATPAPAEAPPARTVAAEPRREAADAGDPIADGPPDGATQGGDSPDVETPDVGTPDVGTPDVGTPHVGTPDVETPDGKSPDGGSAGGDATARESIGAEPNAPVPTEALAGSRLADAPAEPAALTADTVSGAPREPAIDPLLGPTTGEATEEAGPRRLVEALRPRVSRAQLAVALLLGLLGFALAVQVRATQQTGLAGLRQSDLVRVLDDVSERSARLQAEARELERTRDRLSSSSDGRRAAIEETRKRAETLGILAGTLAATGPGIELVIPDPRGEIGPDVLLDAVQELRDAGAEAMQIGDARIVASTSFTDGDGGIAVDGKVQRAPYRLRAIGDQRALSTALSIPGGVLEVLAGKGSKAELAESGNVRVDALAPLADPKIARPAPEPEPSSG